MSNIGYGSTLQVNDGAASAFVAIDDLVDLTPSDPEWQTTESKRLNLTDQAIQEVATLQKRGRLMFTYEYNSTQKARLDSLLKVSKSWKTTPNGGSAGTQPGYLVSNKWNGAITAEGIQIIQGEVVITGPTT